MCFRTTVLPVVLLLITLDASAQSPGLVSGRVLDQTGAALPGVAIDSLVNARVLTAASDAAGTYRVDDVPAGNAELTFRLLNFSVLRRTVAVASGRSVTADAVLTLSLSADVIVTGTATFRNIADVSFLVPELVSGVQFKKGPYSADEGDFSAAGAANVNYVTALDQPMLRLGAGNDGWSRIFAAASPRLGGGSLLGALEVNRDDGPWVRPDDSRSDAAAPRSFVSSSPAESGPLPEQTHHFLPSLRHSGGSPYCSGTRRPSAGIKQRK